MKSIRIFRGTVFTTVVSEVNEFIKQFDSNCVELQYQHCLIDYDEVFSVMVIIIQDIENFQSEGF
ncbi:MAG: hypothetical protein AB7D38_07870 [Sulfurimonas sp.]|uniref:hypothetical protein n=1 Tax=Sulfurimonas sp. TaxID=2022749 RepID=UPI003D0BD66D